MGNRLDFDEKDFVVVGAASFITIPYLLSLSKAGSTNQGIGRRSIVALVLWSHASLTHFA